MNNPIHILVIEGRYYHHISDALLLGAEMALRELGATWEVVTVPGALEIPQVLSAAVSAGLFKEENAQPFHGCVALGCVIRGETSHFDIVAYEFRSWTVSARNAAQHPGREWNIDCRKRGPGRGEGFRERQEQRA